MSSSARRIENPLPLPGPYRKAAKSKTSTSSPPGRLNKRVVPKADGRYLIYYEKP